MPSDPRVRVTLGVVVTQPAFKFTGPAYDYILESDRLPTYDELPDVPSIDDYECRVKLFLNGTRWTYFVAAATWYGDDSVDPILTGWIMSPLGSDLDEWGDTSLVEIMALRDPVFHSLPVERDLHWRPTTVGAIRAGAT